MDATVTGEPLVLEYTPMQEQVFLGSTAKYVIVPAGRRSGKTYGAAQYTIDLMLELGTGNLLWCEVSYGQILSYFDRYWKPILKQLNPQLWHWDLQRRDLHILGCCLSFRSADRPDLLVGLGYKYIFMNEAGIQLFDYKEIWTQVLSPMMLDYQDSRSFIFGTPRGLVGRDGQENLFYSMYCKGLTGVNGYQSYKFSTYDNPRLNKYDIRALEDDIPVRLRNQELFAEFLSISETCIFEPSWFRIIDGVVGPDHIYKKFISIDSAFSEKTVADESCALVGIKEWDGSYTFIDAWHDTVSYPDLVAKIKDLIGIHDPDAVIVENKASGQSLIQTLGRDLPSVGVSKWPRDGVRMQDKVTRAASVSGIIETGKVRLLRGHWNSYLINQATVFPIGDRDDCVDAMTMALQWGKLDSTKNDINLFVRRKLSGGGNRPELPLQSNLGFIRGPIRKRYDLH